MVIRVDIKQGMISCVDTRNPAFKNKTYAGSQLHCAASEIEWI